MLVLLPVSLSPATRPFLGGKACEEAYDEKIYHYARVVWAEGRGESIEGKKAIISALRNGARGYKVGKLKPELVELVVEEMKKPVRHKYRHWINFDLATDRRQIGIAKKAIGLMIDSHWFY